MFLSDRRLHSTSHGQKMLMEILKMEATYHINIPTNTNKEDIHITFHVQPASLMRIIEVNYPDLFYHGLLLSILKIFIGLFQ